jgi:hypothetical protein
VQTIALIVLTARTRWDKEVSVLYCSHDLVEWKLLLQRSLNCVIFIVKVVKARQRLQQTGVIPVNDIIA